MTFKLPDEQAKFEFILTGGLPTATVVQWGNATYIKVCPLCSMLHPLPSSSSAGNIHVPACTLPKTHPTIYAKWLNRFPDAANYRQVRLVEAEAAILPRENVTKRGRAA